MRNVLEALEGQFDVQSVNHVLQYLIFHQFLFFDWSTTFSKNTLLRLNFDLHEVLVPSYQIKPSKDLVEIDMTPFYYERTPTKEPQRINLVFFLQAF